MDHAREFYIDGRWVEPHSPSIPIPATEPRPTTSTRLSIESTAFRRAK
jgi:hypothetical protein